MQKAVKRYMPIFVLPTFCAFILGFIIPFIMGIWLSFCKFTTVTDAKFVGFSNYKKLLRTRYSVILSGTQHCLQLHL